FEKILLDDHHLLQLNNTPTRGNNILDLVITNAPDHVNVTQILSPEETSIFTDHHTISFDFSAFIKKPRKSNQFIPKKQLKDNLSDQSEELSTDPFISEVIVNELEIESLLKTLDSNKATGPDEIPARLLKVTASIIAPSLCKLFNKSLRLGTVPEEWKLANVVPVFKKGEKDHCENYRPISLLSIVSKQLECCVLMNIKCHLSQIICKCQHGFL
ncbi:Hypothetical predicted protein, partial [Paramuricea clavata]